MALKKSSTEVAGLKNQEDIEWVESQTFGIQPMLIGRRMVRERERCIGMTDEERAWRAQWLKDQVLAKDEPKYVPEYNREIRNPVRRFMHYPMDQFERALFKMIGEPFAGAIRRGIGSLFYATIAIYVGCYYFKYVNKDEFEKYRGWRTLTARTSIYPADKDFPQNNNKTRLQDFDPPSLDAYIAAMKQK